MESLIVNGWEYINAIFNVLIVKSDENECLTAPNYIFRGITKRWFTTSTLIDDDKKNIIKEIESIANSEMERNTICASCEKWIQKNIIKSNLREKNATLSKNHKKSIFKEKLESKDYYEFLYERLKYTISFMEEKGIKPYDLLLEIMKTETKSDYNYCVPQFINSGAVVRLKKGSLHPSNLDYVNYIKHMLNDIKIRFPEYKGNNMSDIEILAEMQHKGGATCLADFSTNFLTSLWFATQALDEEIGYLFCYDINRALIQDDKLYILNKNYEHRKIEDLLYETTKKTRFSSKKTYRFWLWRPSNLNERIAMQDSVFIFGLEPFKIKENKVIAIPIPPKWKKPIQHVLKAFFGITAESVYCDIAGYADANSKTRPYTRSFMHYFNESFTIGNNKQSINKTSFDYLHCGMDCLFQGEYKLALKYLSLYETKTGKKHTKDEYQKNKPISNKKKIKEFALYTDVLYSKGICKKHIGDDYGAIYELTEAYETCVFLNQELTHFIAKAKSKDEINRLTICRDYIDSKKEKAFNDLLDMLFITHQYEKASELILKTSSGILDINFRIKIKEAKCCKVIENYLYYLNLYNNTSKAINAFAKSLETDSCTITVNEDSEEITRIKNNQPLIYVLDSFFDSLFNYFTHLTHITHPNESNEQHNLISEYKFERGNFEKFNKAIKEIEKDENHIYDLLYKNDKNCNLFTSWDMGNVENLIQDIVSDIYDNNYQELKYQIGKMKSFINYIQSRINHERS